MAAGVQVITGVTGRIRDAIEAYKAGRLQPDVQPSVAAHFGAGTTSGMGMGMGMTPMPASQAVSLEQEIEMLKTQAQTLGQQLSEIQRRLEELEKGK
jgi:predicted Fe-Mo cluster-binding NifX family protein